MTVHMIHHMLLACGDHQPCKTGWVADGGEPRRVRYPDARLNPVIHVGAAHAKLMLSPSILLLVFWYPNARFSFIDHADLLHLS